MVLDAVGRDSCHVIMGNALKNIQHSLATVRYHRSMGGTAIKVGSVSNSCLHFESMPGWDVLANMTLEWWFSHPENY